MAITHEVIIPNSLLPTDNQTVRGGHPLLMSSIIDRQKKELRPNGPRLTQFLVWPGATAGRIVGSARVSDIFQFSVAAYTVVDLHLSPTKSALLPRRGTCQWATMWSYVAEDRSIKVLAPFIRSATIFCAWM
jgi:hypothetical protein